ncbi:hypothetical protein OK016_14840 [Vibrio chagasii]|nr:hypothetical protein [Vibrio chagasii]
MSGAGSSSRWRTDVIPPTLTELKRYRVDVMPPMLAFESKSYREQIDSCGGLLNLKCSELKFLAF